MCCTLAPHDSGLLCCRIIAADIFMIVLGLAGGVNTHKFKWGYYAMSCFCEVAINIGLLFVAMRAARIRGGGVSKVYAGLAAYLSILWWGYPIVWGLAEGSNTISSDAEVIWNNAMLLLWLLCSNMLGCKPCSALAICYGCKL